MSLSGDFLAILDRVDRKVIHVVDLASGKPLDQTIQHTSEIVEIYLNQYGNPHHRKVAFIDKNNDLYLSYIHKPKLAKLASMINSAMWNDKVSIPLRTVIIY